MWLVIQIALGIVLGFIIVSAAAVVWWRYWGQWAAVRAKNGLLDAVESRVTRAIAAGDESMVRTIKNFRDSMEDSAAAINEGLHLNAQAARIFGAGLALSVVVPLVVTLAERLIFRRR